ncbi:MAG: choice-of-anchor G family protein [Candidatus Microbacterium stercoravium]
MRAEKHDQSTRPKARRLTKKTLAAGGVVTTLAVVGSFAGIGAATADTQTTEADSAAHAHLLWLEGLGLDVAGVGTSKSEFPGTPGPNDDGIDLELLGSLGLEIPELNLPLIKPDAEGAGLLHLGALGVGGSRSSSTSATESLAASGLLSENGGLDLDAYDGEISDPAYVDLTSTIEQLLGEGALDEVLSAARVELGAVGSEITKNGAEVNSQYRVADLGLELTSPLLGDVTGLVDDIVGGVVDPLNDAIGPEGSLGGIVNTLVEGLDLSVPVVGGLTSTLETPLSLDVSSLTDSVREGLLLAPLDNSTTEEDATVSIDLNNGSITADLGGLLLASNPEYTDLNDLPANTDVLSDDVVNALTQGVLEALTGTGPNSLTSKAVDLVEEGLYGVELGLAINLNVSLLGIPAVNTTLSLLAEDGEPATLGGILGADGYTPAGLDIADEGILGGLLTPVLGVVTTALNGLTDGLGVIVEGAAGEDGILDTLQPTISGVLNPIVTALVGDEGAIKGLLDGAATITINEQPQELATPAPGDLGDESLSVRALSVSVLPGLLANPVKLELASSTVKALDEAPYDTSIEVEPGSIAQGETATVTGSGFEPGETVTVTLDGETIGTATAEEDGSFTLDYTAADDAETGDFVVEAVGDESNAPATDGLTITEGDAGADPEADANTDADVNADADVNGSSDDEGDVNANAASSASASANADDDSNASAQAAAQAAANADADTAASAAADADATAAAESAATADASSDASSDVSSDVNASAQAAAQAAANADASSDANAEASAAADANAAAASQAASNADSSSDASTNAAADVNGSSDDNADADVNGSSDDEGDVNANAASSASASANADDDSNASAQAAAQAAANADADTAASAAADADATAAAESAATADASSDASSDVSSDVNASAQAAAQAAANADASSDANAEASAAADANAAAASQAASNADSSSDASTNAAADVNGSSDDNADADVNGSSDDEGDVNANAASSASASANADDDSNASAQAAAQAAANADADTAASAAADADATAAAESAATADASSDASSDVSSDVNASAQAAAQAAANADASSDANAEASAAADANAAAASQAASNADSSSDASSEADASSDSDASASASASSASASASNANASSDSNGGLSPTGGDMSLPLGGLAIAMLLAGAGVWFVTRRRANA